MRYLLAAADRDLLTAYGQYLSDQGMPAAPVFDAVQLRTTIASGTPGLCFLDKRLPLMSHEAAVAMLKQAGWRVIALSDGEPEPGSQADVTLCCPFTPEELMAAVYIALPRQEERQAKVDE